MKEFIGWIINGIRFRARMAALFAWIIGSVTGVKRNDTTEDSPNIRTKLKSSKLHQKQRYRGTSIEEPTFNTTLTTPIEEVLEETVTDDLTTSSKKSPVRRRPKKSKKSSSSGESSPVDESDFIPVRDRKSRKTQKSPPIPSSGVEIKKPTNLCNKSKENLNDSGNLESIKPVAVVEIKESKKVTSEISYAKVTSKSFGSWEEICVDEELKTDTARENIREIVESIDNNSVDSSEESKSAVEYLIVETETYTRDSEENQNLQPNGGELDQEIIDNDLKSEGSVEEIALKTQQFIDETLNLQQNNKEPETDCLEVNNLEEHTVAEELVEETVTCVSEIEESVNQQQESTETSNLEKHSIVQKFVEETVTCVSEIEEQQREERVEANNFEEHSVVEDFVQQTEELVAQQQEELTKMSSGQQIRVLTLNDKEHHDSTVYRLEKNWILQFRIGPSLMGRKINLYCNYPKSNEKFDRNVYNLLEWQQDEGCEHSDDTANLIEIKIKLSGSFHYYFTYDNDVDNNKHQGSGFFLIDPILKYGKNEELPLDCIQCQTVLAKCLGPFDTWQNKLLVAKETGYNMIHFTPIQELGDSNSSYSLSDRLKVNPVFKKTTGEPTNFADIEDLIKKMRTEWKILSICDIVLNHTANESEWLKQHPEVTYNCLNCPYMRPCYLLDAALYQFSIDISDGLYEDRGIPIEVNTEEHLNSIRYHLQTDLLPKINLQEMFICDVNGLVAEFANLARNTVVSTKNNIDESLELIQDPEYRRLKSRIDMNLALKLYNVYRPDCFDEEARLKRCTEELKHKLDSLNNQIIETINNHLNAAVENCIAGIRYFRVQSDGPRIKLVSSKHPLVARYFTDYPNKKCNNLKDYEAIIYSDNGRFLMAHNGWVMNADPLKNFASPDSHVYLRRELIAWGDSVKLRYGDKPEDCPFLWNFMREYVEQTVRIFDGVRLDNCHSTPIPVAEYLLDCARRIRPDLYVVAELFTNSDMTDNIFVNRLGITSLIGEAMSAWDSHEQGRLVYRYGGCPVGSFHQPNIRPLVPSIAHALFLDLTHDNPSPISKRSVFDLLPSTALVNMACCASGSNRGYDELVPHHIHVVDEKRQYTEWTTNEQLSKGNLRYVTRNTGILSAKKALNNLHFLLGKQGFNQVYVDQMDPDIVAITRHCPDTHQSYILVAFTAFSHPPENTANNQRHIRPLRVEGVLDEIVLEASLTHINPNSKYAKFEKFIQDSQWINGLNEYQVVLNEHLQPENSTIFERVDSGDAKVVQLNFTNFKPGSIAVIKMSLPQDMKDAIKNVRNLLKQFSLTKESELTKIINELNLSDLNRCLYRCGEEERDEGFGFDTYNIPGYGNLIYAGLQGFMSLLSTIRPNNNLGHPMCANLRDGSWMIDYICQRLKLDEGTKQLGQWFEENTKSLKVIPRYLVPCYFDVVVTGVYVLLIERCFNLMSDFVKNGSTFVKALSLGSVQLGGYVKSADLPTLSPNLAPPKPAQRKMNNGELKQACISLSAGLPHFAVGYMRNWGRDTFITLPGLLLLTNRYQETRYHILGYAQCLRHGLIPNLLDGGRNPRFNCRDAIWWWLYCIKCYVEYVPNGIQLLSDKVSRIFPKDDSPAQLPGTNDQPLCDVIQEALLVHFQGLIFRERNAGKQIDEHMTDKGFNNQIGIHPETGFVFGGNQWNCGTWMDRMGSSDKAGNRGKPATPRDGSAIELIGLSKACISWLDSLYQQKLYPYDGVKRVGKNGIETKWTFKEWANKIQVNFEKYFYINTEPIPNEIRPDLINKRGIYKDCYGASQEWTDYQLRCNFPIAMVVAPELFNPKHAWIALENAEKYLLGPLGMKTLDPEDWAYNGVYDNANDSNDFNTAHGLNYHQGPEWLWPIGYFLRAKLQFAQANGVLDETLSKIKVILSKHFVELQTSQWRGLPELTNKNGEYCSFSCRTQAWSMGCVLEVLHDLQRIEQKQPTKIN